MLDITWKVFSQTGNIETYLLLKELENVGSKKDNNQLMDETDPFEQIKTLNEM